MDDDKKTDFHGILGNLAAQPGGLLGGLFPPPPAYDPQQPGALPPGADPTTLSLAAAASASELARTLRNIDHQAAIMAAFGKAMGAPGTRSVDTAAQGAGAGSSVPADAPYAESSAQLLARQGPPAQAASPAPVNANSVFQRSPVPLPPPRPKVADWPVPGIVDQRWALPGAEIPNTGALLHGIASLPSPTDPVAENADWSSQPHDIASVASPSLTPRLEKPDTRALLQDIVDIPSQTPSQIDFPTLRTFGIDPDDLTRRIVRAENPSEDPNAKAASTTATGLTQFTKDTWRDVLKPYRRDLYDYWSGDPKETGLQALRTDPALSRQMAAAYADENVKVLDRANIPVTYRNIYLAHFLGPSDATNLLRADPDTSARSVLSPASVRANHRLITPAMTVRDLIHWGEDRMEHGAGWRQPAR